MVDLTAVDATREHVRLVWLNLARDDEQEIVDMGVRPRDGVLDSWRASIWRRAALIDGEPAALWGVGGDLLSAVGAPWLLTTPLVERAPLACLRLARREMRDALRLYPVLRNLVSIEHKKALRFLEKVGFELGRVEPAGRYGKLFREVTMKAERHGD